MNTVKEKWESFSAATIPAKASKEQVTDMRNAFYAGAMVVMDIQYAIGGDAYSEEAGVAVLEGLHEEMEQHIQSLKK